MIRQHDRFRLSKPALLFILPPLAVFMAGDLLFGRMFGDIGWTGANGFGPGADPHEEAVLRTYFLTSFLALIAIGLVLVLQFAIDLAQLFDGKARKALLATAGIGLAIAAVWYLVTLGAFPKLTVPIEDYLGRSFLEHRLSGEHPTLFTLFTRVMNAARITILLGSTAVIVGAVSCLAEVDARYGSAGRALVDRLQRQRLRRYVNGASALMVAGLLFMLAWMRWPLFAIAPGDHATYLRLVEALGVFFGVHYSLVIASYSIPIGTLLRLRRAGGAMDAAESPSAALLNGIPSETLQKALAVLAPTLASLLPGFFDLLQR